MKIALAWAAAIAVPVSLTYAAYPVRPGPDMPVFVGIALIIWCSVVSALAASEWAMRRWSA